MASCVLSYNHVNCPVQAHQAAADHRTREYVAGQQVKIRSGAMGGSFEGVIVGDPKGLADSAELEIVGSGN